MKNFSLLGVFMLLSSQALAQGVPATPPGANTDVSPAQQIAQLTNSIANTQAASQPYKPRLFQFTPFTRISGLTYLSDNDYFDNGTSLISTSGAEISIGRKVFFFTQIGYYTSLISPQNSVQLGSGIYNSTGLGINVYDSRNAEGIGKSLALKVGAAGMYSFNKRQPFIYSDARALPIGGTLLIDYQANLNKNVGFRLGFELSAYSLGVLHTDPDPEDFFSSYGLGIGDLVSFEEGLGLSYGLTVGFTF